MDYEVLTSEITSVGFGFLKAEEIRRVSVKEIVSPFSHDQLGRPVATGLMDPAMGPSDNKEQCQTCTLPGTSCPGHFGHIELPVSVYNPMLFSMLYKMLGSYCWCCQGSRMKKSTSEVFVLLFKLLKAGLLLDVTDAEEILSATSRGGQVRLRLRRSNKQIEEESRTAGNEDGGDKDADTAPVVVEDLSMDNSERLAEFRAKWEQLAAQTKRSPYEPTSTHDIELRSKLIAAYFNAVPSRKCSNCNGISPSLRRDGYIKLFVLPLSKKLWNLQVRQNVVIKDTVFRQLFRAGDFDKVAESHGMFDDDSKLNAAIDAASKASANAANDEAKEEAKEEAMMERELALAKAGELDRVLDSSSSDDEDSDDNKNDVSDSDADDNDSVVSGSDNEDENSAGGASTAAKTAAAKAAAKAAKLSRAQKMEERRRAEAQKARWLFPSEVQERLKLLWFAEHEVLNAMWGLLVPDTHISRRAFSFDHKMFFFDILAVPPPRFRPQSVFGDQQFENPQNASLKTVLELSQQILSIQDKMRALEKKARGQASGSDDDDDQDEEHIAQEDEMQQQRASLNNQFALTWINLQTNVNAFMDSAKAGGRNLPAGIRQLLEKKEGLFRQHMMGKRVDYAARSVISPDPFLLTNEIGVPIKFARTLSYVQPVTAWNAEKLREMVLNGPYQYPGANFIEDENGIVTNLAAITNAQRIALANTLRTGHTQVAAPITYGRTPSLHAIGRVKKVRRHLLDGDVMLVNRQPTLHKPSIMAMRARILHGQQTIRMHYANCNTFNADFDGDEMNLHFPQNELARAEGYMIANADNQYCKPTDGTPLRGLIQDHVASGVLLTKKDTFLTREEFQQLLYSACVTAKFGASARDFSASAYDTSHRSHVMVEPFHMEPPAILKPVPMWTGKQVITSILNHLTGARAKLTMEGGSKIPRSAWGEHAEESRVLIRNNELLRGVLDKSQFGASKNGMVHCVHEAYGPETAGQLLSIFSRLFTIFLQKYGYTCGLSDMVLQDEAELSRTKRINRAVKKGTEASLKYAGMSTNPEEVDYDVLLHTMRKKLASSANASAALDSALKNTLNPASSAIMKVCVPDGLKVPFPDNCLALMIMSGAKGSMVNYTQISCLLGQQELEGKRVPIMASGRTLPSFRRYDPSPRAGGYITDRFLTGIRPQEYYFHCMAGREGLVDTAVKTATSGYLQRCLIKHLESLCLGYDYTVRDVDNAVVQFTYGEDGIDVTRSQYLSNFAFYEANFEGMVARLAATDAMRKGLNDIATAPQKRAELAAAAEELGVEPEPLLAHMSPASHLGVVSEKFHNDLEKYCSEMQARLEADYGNSDSDSDSDSASDVPQKKKKKIAPATEVQRFRVVMHLNYMKSLAQPGESVGVLAGQSVGEPSTQMTLNTFHLAGHGGANVTLGIPRLREIIMTASGDLKTPIMELPLLPFRTHADAKELAARLNRVVLGDYVKSISVSESMDTVAHGATADRLYKIKLSFLPIDSAAVRRVDLQVDDFQRAVDAFLPVLFKAIAKECVRQGFHVRDTGTKSTKGKGARKADSKVVVEVADAEDAEADLAITSSKVKDVSKRKLPMSHADVEDAQMRKEREQHREQDYGRPDDDERAEVRAEIAKAKKRNALSNIDEELEELEEQDEDDADADVEMSVGKKGKKSKKTKTKTKTKTKKKKTFQTERTIFAHPFLRSCTFDTKEAAWAEIVTAIPTELPKLLMSTLVQEVCRLVVLRETRDIKGCFVVEKRDESGEKRPVVQTDGVNFYAAWANDDIVDVDRIASNDIRAVLRTYGVEAARACIAREVAAVFNVYGISVDKRHLSLIGDYMTFQGDFRPMNRTGIADNPSPFQKMSFETSSNFLLDACVRGDVDYLRSPSARIVLGEAVRCGTNMFDVGMDL
jgi:DNA-directed RNA polymerase I subunit RPA1